MNFWLGVIAVLAIIVAIVLAVIVIMLLNKQKELKKNIEKSYDTRMAEINQLYLKKIPKSQRENYLAMYFRTYSLELDISYDRLKFLDKIAAYVESLNNDSDDVTARISKSGFVILHKFDTLDNAHLWANRLLKRFNVQSAVVLDKQKYITKAGAYVLSGEDDEFETVLRQLKICYNAASRTGTTYSFLSEHELNIENERINHFADMERAVKNHEFKHFLQPIVSTKTQKIVGAESLARWDHPSRGLLFPRDFILLMIEENTISLLDFELFEMSCKAICEWEKKGYDYYISCNFARATIDSDKFFDKFKEIAEKYDFDRSKLYLEITDDSVEGNVEQAMVNITRCKQMGFRIALDDIGAGNTSFADFGKYDIDLAKIDRSIVSNLDQETGVKLLESIIQLATKFNMRILCEGVETEEQLKTITDNGCDFVQGYYFYKPAPREEIEEILQKENT